MECAIDCAIDCDIATRASPFFRFLGGGGCTCVAKSTMLSAG